MSFEETEQEIDGLFIRQIAEHKYLIQSKSDPSKIYEVDLNNKEDPHPDCQGYYYRGICSHMEALKSFTKSSE